MPAPKPAWASTKADICPALLQSTAAVVLVGPKAAQGVPGCDQCVCPVGRAVSWGTRSRGHQGMLSEGSPCAVSKEARGARGWNAQHGVCIPSELAPVSPNHSGSGAGWKPW